MSNCAQNCPEFTAHNARSHCCSLWMVFIVTYICSRQSTRQAMYVSRNTEALSCIHWFGGKAVSIAYADVCVCSLSYPACNKHAPYCLWPVRFFHIFPHYFTIFENKFVHEMCVLIFSITFAWNISDFKKKWARYDKKCISVFMESACHSGQILIKFEFSRHIFEKYSNIQFHANPLNGNRVVPCQQTDVRTDRHDVTNIYFSQFTERAQKLKTTSVQTSLSVIFHMIST